MQVNYFQFHFNGAENTNLIKNDKLFAMMLFFIIFAVLFREFRNKLEKDLTQTYWRGGRVVDYGSLENC